MKNAREFILERIAWYDDNAHSWRFDKNSPTITSKVNPPKPVEEMTDEELVLHFEKVVLIFERTKISNCLPDH